MGIILKHTFKNIIGKPGRTLLLTLCIFMCSLAAVLCLDMTKSVERLLTNEVTNMVGSTDIILVTEDRFPDDWQEGLPEFTALQLFMDNTSLHRRDPQLYSYAIDDPLNICGLDLQKAYDMKLLLTPITLQPTETAMTEDIANLYHYQVGDTINLYDMRGEKVPFTIAQIFPKGGLFRGNTCVISEEATALLYSEEARNFGEIVIDIANDRLIDSAYDTLKARYPEMEIENIKHNEDMASFIRDISNLFLTIFAVCLIVVVIITMTISERIMNERIPVVGTLRSLGVSARKTTVILLLENVLYALIGSLPAMVVYGLIRDVALDAIFVLEGESTMDFGSISFLTYVIIVVGAILVECICTLKETLRASRMAIRDVIFQGHDAEYRISPTKNIIGCVCLVISVACAFCNEAFFPLILSFILGVLGVYLLFPVVTASVANALGKCFTKANMPIAGIASNEIAVRKSTIASTSLIVVSTAIAIALFIFSDSMGATLLYPIFKSDIIVEAQDEDYLYDYIKDLEGVSAKQEVFLSRSNQEIKINDTTFKEYTIVAMEEGDMFCGVIGMDEPVKENEILVSEDILKKAGVQVGDEITLALNMEFLLPSYFRCKIAGVCNTVYVDECGRGIAINIDTYRNFISDSGATLLVNTDEDPETIVEKIRTYSVFNNVNEVQSVESYMRELAVDNHSQTVMIRLLGLMGVLLTLIGVVSNQLIGFESRKRENAVLLSTSMNRAALRKMLLLETFLSSAISLICAIPLGILIYIPITKIMACFRLNVPTVWNVPEILAVIAVLLLLFTITVLFPYAALRKMKLAEQLKYE